MWGQFDLCHSLSVQFSEEAVPTQTRANGLCMPVGERDLKTQAAEKHRHWLMGLQHTPERGS